MNTPSMNSTQRTARAAAGQRGYALVALLALMTVLMIMMMAAAPSIRQQSRRDLELEAIARGEEVAEAIRMYIHYKNTPPTSMDELVEGVAPPGRTKKVQVLRASAARDPLSSTGEWKIIKPNDREFITFLRALAEYGDGKLPNPTNDRALAVVKLPQITSIVTGLDAEDTAGGEGGEDESLSSNGPFVGVASRSRRDSVVTYYGISRHNGWVFTPFYR